MTEKEKKEMEALNDEQVSGLKLLKLCADLICFGTHR